MESLTIAEPKIRLLCVDDSDHLTSAWSRLIQNQPDMVMVGTLSCADDLVSTVQSSGAVVVLMDVTMDGRDPFEALAELHHTCPDVGTLIYSGRSEPQLVERAMKAGARGYLDKGRPPARILDAIRRVARGEHIPQ